MLLAWSSLLLGACASSQTKPEMTPRSSSEHKMVNPLDLDDQDDPDGMQVEGMLGTLDEDVIQAGLEPRLEQVSQCFRQGSLREPYLHGAITWQFRIARSGRVKELKIIESTLGSYTIERCIQAQLQRTTFSPPRGGEAEFTYPLKFHGKVEVVRWDESMVKDELEKQAQMLLTRTEEGSEQVMTAPEGLIVTFYVDHQGQVLSAGLAAQDVIDDAFAQTLIENLKKVQFVEPHAKYAKVTYTW